MQRREFLSQTMALTSGLCWPAWLGNPLLQAADAPAAAAPPAKPARKVRVACLFSEFRLRSHAYHFLESSLGPYLFSGKIVEPPVEIVSMYADIFPENDMAREASKRFNIPLYKTATQALCCGGQELAVDAVLLIFEQGNYPFNSRGQQMYPRKQFFDETVAVMRRSNRFVPIFNDKHLSYRWDWAQEMYNTARYYKIPFMAGSSVPLGSRRQPLDLPAGSQIEEAVSIHGGPPESYDFHGIELLQSFVESRRGGETGIASVQFLEGESLWNAARQGCWSKELADAALKAELGQVPTDWNSVPGDTKTGQPHGLLIQYKDGLRATVLKVGANSARWNFACRLRSDPQIHATSIYTGPWGNRNLFKALSHAVQSFFVTGQAPYPVERTLLASGLLDMAMLSRDMRGCCLDVSRTLASAVYQPRDFTPFRETGASWKILTKETPEPKTFAPGLDPRPR